MSTNWASIAEKLDPTIPDEQYNSIRNRYFVDVVKPKIGKDESVEATYKEFLKRSERPLSQKARQMGEKVGDMASKMLVSGIEMSAVSAALGPVVGAASESLLGMGKAAQFASKVATMGLTFGTYDALEAKDGDRVAAGVHGAMTGALWEVGLGTLFGFGEKAAQETIKSAINHEAGPATEKVVADGIKASTEAARKQGVPASPTIITPTMKGMAVHVKDAEGIPTVIKVPRGTESDVIGQIQEALDKGGSIDMVRAHPASQARASELMNHFADAAEGQTKSTRIHVEPGQAEPVAARLTEQGIHATVADDGTVLAGPAKDAVKAQEATEALERFKPKEDVDQSEIDKKMMRIGEIRTRIQASGEKQGPPVPRAVHAEMHTLQGDVATIYHTSRETVGQLAERHFRNSGQGDIIDTLERYGGKYPLAPGERAAKGNLQNLEGDLSRRILPREAVGKGDAPFRKALPASERTVFSVDDVTGELRSRPIGRTMRASKSAEELGFAGVVPQEPVTVSGPGASRSVAYDPIRILASDATAADAYHESVHQGAIYAGLHDEFPTLIQGHEQTAIPIAQRLMKEFPGYRVMDKATIMNEAFTHSAEAVRMGDQPYLEELGRWDTSVEHVKQFVGSTAKNALEASMKGDSAPIRAFQRRMNDLVRRTDPMRTAALERAQLHGYTTWFSPEINQWIMRDGEGREVLKASLDDVWDHVEGADASAHFPDIANKAYFKGLKGPLVPLGTEPVEGPTTLDIPDVPLGAQAVSGLFRTLDGWASSVQRKLTKLGVDLPFYDRIKDVELARKGGYREMDRLNTELGAIMKGVPNARRLDYGELLAKDESEWPALSERLGLSTADLANVRELSEMDRTHVGKGGISLVDTLKLMDSVRQNGDRALNNVTGRAADAISAGHLGGALDVGAVSQWAFRNTIDENFMKEPLRAFQDLVATKTSTGKPAFRDIDYSIQNYIRSVRGQADKSETILSRFSDQMFQGIEDRLNQVNKSLPSALQHKEPIKLPKNVLEKYQRLLYLGGLGARPAVGIRDLFQGMQAMSVLGPSAFAEGVAKAMTPEGWAKAEAIRLSGHRIGEVFGDLSEKLPVGGSNQWASKAADALLTPSRIGHNLPRSAVYLGEEARAMRQIAKYRAGIITAPQELADSTGAWFQHDAPKARLLALAADPKVPIEQAAHEFARALVERTQFGDTQGAILRTGMGRLFGQYASWPMSHLDFARQLISRAADNPKKGVPALAGWMAINYGGFAAASSLGIDAGKWLFFSPAGYGGSPTADLVKNVFLAPEESPAGFKARKDIMEFPLEMIPGSVELQAIHKAFAEDDLSLPRLLGFKPLTPKQEEDWEQWLLEEGGFEKRK